MAKKNESQREAVKTANVDLFALLLSALYFQSVLTDANHAGMWVHNGTTHVVESPDVTFLIIALLLCAYSWRKQFKPSTMVIISLTVLVTSSIFWLSGLRTNFYF